jgi:2-polyprenyl-3-methyl-5-hydroxy-6-metoxy-1,4-benzoquinol methylase
MPLPDLARRDADVRELMDAPDADPRMLARTYRRFETVNRMLSGWRRLYRRRIRDRVLARDVRVLDIGSGGGDIARSIARWCAADARSCEVVAADADPRATAWAALRAGPVNVTYVTAMTGDLVREGERFDVVLSNHLLHHLQDDELETVLSDSARLLRPGGLALHNDIARSRAAYALFGAATWPFEAHLLRDTFIRADGLTSIRRSYTASELRARAPQGWEVATAVPFRLVLTREAPRG